MELLLFMWFVFGQFHFQTCRGATTGMREMPDWEAQSISQGDNLGMVCTGLFPDFASYLLSPLHNPYVDSPVHGRLYANLIHLCARADWGGSVLNAGASCNRMNADPSHITIDFRRPKVPWTGSVDFRLSQYCFTKCHCYSPYGLDILTQLPGGYGGIRSSRSFFVYERAANVFLPVYYSPAQVQSSPFVNVEHLGEYFGGMPFRFTASTTGAGSHRIVCNGALPEMAVQRFAPYNSLTEYCAAGIYGGRSRGNAGGYCPGSPMDDLIAFDEEYIDPIFFFHRASLAYCQLRCYCADAGRTSNDARRRIALTGLMADETNPRAVVLSNPEFQNSQYSPFRGSAGTSGAGQGGYSGSRRPDGAKQQATLYITPTRPGHVSVRLSTCQYFGDPDCEWLGMDDIFCPNSSCTVSGSSRIPRQSSSMVRVTPVIDTPESIRNTHSNGGGGGESEDQGKKQQGQTQGAVCASDVCTGPQSCGGECVCTVDQRRKQVGLQGLPVFPDSKCRTIGFLNVLTSNLGKRDGDSLANDEPFACVCNSTYVSRACCGCQDGMVWEDSTLKLGNMA